MHINDISTTDSWVHSAHTVCHRGLELQQRNSGIIRCLSPLSEITLWFYTLLFMSWIFWPCSSVEGDNWFIQLRLPGCTSFSPTHRDRLYYCQHCIASLREGKRRGGKLGRWRAEEKQIQPWTSSPASVKQSHPYLSVQFEGSGATDGRIKVWEVNRSVMSDCEEAISESWAAGSLYQIPVRPASHRVIMSTQLVLQLWAGISTWEPKGKTLISRLAFQR